jgi:uncharacterized membrane protein YgcG
MSLSTANRLAIEYDELPDRTDRVWRESSELSYERWPSGSRHCRAAADRQSSTACRRAFELGSRSSGGGGGSSRSRSWEIASDASDTIGV